MTEVKNSRGVCPVCNGTGHMPCPDAQRQYGISNGWFGYNAENDTVICTNCGGQYMFGKASGTVKLRPDSSPCKHSYQSRTGRWRSTTNYSCVHCNDTYVIDSGD